MSEAFCNAFKPIWEGTPLISYIICPDLTGHIQKEWLPLPLPIRVAIGLRVTDLEVKTLIQRDLSF